MFFKFIINLFAASSVLGGAEDWIPVPKVPKLEEVTGELDPSVWVLFSKKWGADTLLVRFPEDPVYRTTKDGFLARSKGAGEIFELWIQRGGGGGLEGDSLFELEGKWIHERTLQKGDHTYRLRVYSLDPETPNRDQFFDFFRISS